MSKSNKRQAGDLSMDTKKNKECNDYISVDQLPDINLVKITLYFDTSYVKRKMYLCHNGKDIWDGKLPCPNNDNHCSYQNFANVLKEKYGWRLYDVIPTADSQYFSNDGTSPFANRYCYIYQRIFEPNPPIHHNP